jgi:cellulose synthase/poly-beta-1,6-N-acetylglucosamine synthase-like glycosyltransferase
MKTILFVVMCGAVLTYLWWIHRRPPSPHRRSVDVVVPAYNEEPCIRASLLALLGNPYVARVICVNDGSSDGTAAVINALAAEWPGRLIPVHQPNGGKGSALMHGLRYVSTDAVFLTDADTIVPADNGLGFLLAEIERGAHAAGGIPSSALRGAGLLPRVRASVKLPMIAIKRTFQQLVGGAPFIVSGACGMFRSDVLRMVGMSDRTKVEDLDLTWTLVARGYRVRQVNRCIVYPQECNTIPEEWRRWKRWIVGYAVCMRLHRRLLLTRFGVVSILPMFLLVAYGVWAYAVQVGALAVTGPWSHNPWSSSRCCGWRRC